MAKRKRRAFTAEFKADAVRLCRAGDRSISHVSKDLGSPGSVGTGATSLGTLSSAGLTPADGDAGGGGDPGTKRRRRRFQGEHHRQRHGRRRRRRRWLRRARRQRRRHESGRLSSPPSALRMTSWSVIFTKRTALVVSSPISSRTALRAHWRSSRARRRRVGARRLDLRERPARYAASHRELVEREASRPAHGAKIVRDPLRQLLDLPPRVCATRGCYCARRRSPNSAWGRLPRLHLRSLRPASETRDAVRGAELLGSDHGREIEGPRRGTAAFQDRSRVSLPRSQEKPRHSPRRAFVSEAPRASRPASPSRACAFVAASRDARRDRALRRRRWKPCRRARGSLL